MHGAKAAVFSSGYLMHHRAAEILPWLRGAQKDSIALSPTLILFLRQTHRPAKRFARGSTRDSGHSTPFAQDQYAIFVRNWVVPIDFRQAATLRCSKPCLSPAGMRVFKRRHKEHSQVIDQGSSTVLLLPLRTVAMWLLGKYLRPL
jgi:hypothetical protein